MAQSECLAFCIKYNDSMMRVWNVLVMQIVEVYNIIFFK